MNINKTLLRVIIITIIFISALFSSPSSSDALTGDLVTITTSGSGDYTLLASQLRGYYNNCDNNQDFYVALVSIGSLVVGSASQNTFPYNNLFCLVEQ